MRRKKEYSVVESCHVDDWTPCINCGDEVKDEHMFEVIWEYMPLLTAPAIYCCNCEKEAISKSASLNILHIQTRCSVMPDEAINPYDDSVIGFSLFGYLRGLFK